MQLVRYKNSNQFCSWLFVPSLLKKFVFKPNSFPVFEIWTLHVTACTVELANCHHTVWLFRPATRTLLLKTILYLLCFSIKHLLMSQFLWFNVTAQRILWFNCSPSLSKSISPLISQQSIDCKLRHICSILLYFHT